MNVAQVGQWAFGTSSTVQTSGDAAACLDVGIATGIAGMRWVEMGEMRAAMARLVHSHGVCGMMGP